MSDLIERQVAIDAIIEDKICDDSLKIMTAIGDGDKAETLNMTCDRHAKMLMSLPSAQPERKTGKWSVEFSPAYKGGAYCECSQCNYKFAMGAYFEPDEWNFCPYCGADMRGEA